MMLNTDWKTQLCIPNEGRGTAELTAVWADTGITNQISCVFSGLLDGGGGINKIPSAS